MGQGKLRGLSKAQSQALEQWVYLAESPASVLYWVPSSGTSGAAYPGETDVQGRWKVFGDHLEAAVAD